MPTITDQLGRVLGGRYRLDAGLGTGSSAHVYLAFDLQLARAVAVKLLHAGLAGDEAFLRRFRAEAQTAAVLNHPNIVRIYDWGEEDGEPFLVLEYLAGGTLRDLFDRGEYLGPSEVARIGAEAARGLEHAHRRGLIHRDIKPANLIFDEDGVVHVADFGLARALADAAWTEPAGAVFGTARYAAPEQLSGMVVDERSDVYSLALVCYEALVGRAPFRGDTTLATLLARVKQPLPPSPALGPLAPILAGAALSEPLARPDAGAFAADLELLAMTLPPPQPLPLEWRPAPQPQAVAARPVARSHDTEPVAVVPAPAPPAGPAHGASREWRSGRVRHRLLRRTALALGVVAVVVAGATAYVRLAVYGDVVPRLVGLPVATATDRISHAGLRIAGRSTRYSTELPSGSVIGQSLPAGRHVRANTPVELVVSKGHAPVAVPHLLGSNETVALARIGRAHFIAHVVAVYSETVPSGVVVSASRAHGVAPFGSPITVELSKGPHPRTIPSFADSTWADVSGALSALRLMANEVLAYSSTVPAGTVISTTPAEGSSGVDVGSTVTVVVSRGPRLVAVPTVAGDTIAQAVATLEASGLVVAEQVGPPFATDATTTDPAPGSELSPGASVTLYVA